MNDDMTNATMPSGKPDEVWNASVTFPGQPTWAGTWARFGTVLWCGPDTEPLTAHDHDSVEEAQRCAAMALKLIATNVDATNALGGLILGDDYRGQESVLAIDHGTEDEAAAREFDALSAQLDGSAPAMDDFATAVAQHRTV